MLYGNGVIKTNEEEVYDENCGGVGNVIFEALHTYKDRVALIDSQTDKYDTYSGRLKKSTLTARALQRRGFKTQDLIAVCSNKENTDADIVILAGHYLGCVTFSLHPDHSVRDCSDLLVQIPPKIIFVTEKAKDLIENAMKRGNIQSELIIFGKQFEKEFLEDARDDVSFKPAFIKNLQTTCMIHFSSGSTGIPKPVCLNHYYMLSLRSNSWIHMSQSLQEATFDDRPIGSVSLIPTNWYWVSSSMDLMTTIFNGGCRILIEKVDLKNLWKLVEKYHVTQLYVRPMWFSEVCKYGMPKNVDISSLKFIVTGGSSVHQDYIKSMRQLVPGVTVLQGYGSTETGLATSFDVTKPSHRALLNEKIGSVGLPVKGLKYKVVDLDTGKLCGPNQPGELCVQGKRIFNGYYNRDASTEFDKEGYLKTGDLVYFDENVCFYILDRLKSFLRWKGIDIYPHQIENVLMSHPEVESAIVIGVPHKEELERAMGVVVVKKDANVTEQELINFVDKQVEDHKRLRQGIRFVKELPTNVNGKIDRKRVKDMILKSLPLVPV